MTNKISAHLLVWLAASAIVVGAMADENKSNSIKVNADQPGTRLSPMLFGGFLEHMFTCIEGGLWGELLNDRKLAGALPDGAALPKPWEINGSTTDTTFQVSLKPPRHGDIKGDQSHSLKISLPAGKPTIVRLAAPVFVAAKETYRLTVWLKQEANAGSVSFRFESKSGESLSAPQPVTRPDRAWKRYDLKLSATATDNDARLVCEFHGPSTLWFDSPSLMREDKVSGTFDRQVWEAVRALQLGFLRYPGGNFAQTYHWRDGIGPRDDRTAGHNIAWENKPEPNDCGTDEYLAFCRSLAIEPTICVNVEGQGATAQEAADWVAYCNSPASTPLGRLRAKHGHPQPYHVKYWELGNEVYGNWETGNCDAATYAKRAATYARAMRAVDPTIKLTAVGDSRRWDREVLKECAGLIDFLAQHSYINQENFADLMSEPSKYEHWINGTRALIRELSPSRPVQLAVNEWNAGMVNAAQWQLRSALFGAGLLNAFARQGDIVTMACSSDLVNGWPGGVIQRNGAQIFRTPLYYVEEMYRDNLGERLLPVTVTGPTFKSPGFNTELPALDVTASAGPTGAPIYLWVINRTEQDSPQTEISVTGGKTKLQRADVWTLTAESPLIANDYEHPARIVPVQTKLTINGENLVYQFPKNSVVVMRLSP